MSIRLINYASGEIEIFCGDGPCLRLPREKAHRLILHARMHSVSEFVGALQQFISDPNLAGRLLDHFNRLQTPSDRWAFKERFARLTTLAHEAPGGDPAEVVEEVGV